MTALSNIHFLKDPRRAGRLPVQERIIRYLVDRYASDRSES